MQNPIELFLTWYEDAVRARIKNAEAMTLATSTPSGMPSARIVLYKGMNDQGLKFFTNYESQKGLELQKNPYAALVFYWSALDRQIRIEGKVQRLSETESDAYWNTRPRESRIHALASPQSSLVSDREFLDGRVSQLKQKFPNEEVPRPSHWGGFCLIPHRFEFWSQGEFRLHDRFNYVRIQNGWKMDRLAP